MQNNGRKLKSMGIFYKSDQPSGFGMLFLGEDARRMLANFESCYQRFKESPIKEQEEYLNRGAEEDLRRALHLNPYARDGKVYTSCRTDNEALFLTFGPLTIYILEREKRIVSDEFNGCQFVYEP